MNDSPGEPNNIIRWESPNKDYYINISRIADNAYDNSNYDCNYINEYIVILDIYNIMNTKIDSIKVDEYDLLEIMYNLAYICNGKSGDQVLKDIKVQNANLDMKIFEFDKIDNDRYNIKINVYNPIYERMITIFNTILSYQTMIQFCYNLSGQLFDIDPYVVASDEEEVDFIIDFINQMVDCDD